MKTMLLNTFRSWWRAVALLLVLLTHLGVSHAATTEIANAPLFTSSSSAVKPNVMFILDDSGSMKYDYLPDPAGFSTTKYGRKASQCNGVAYNPAITYTLPVDATGASLAAASLDFITADPTTQTTNTRTISVSYTLTTLRYPSVMGTGVTVTMTIAGSSMGNTTYEVGDEVTLYKSGNKTTWIEATVTRWVRSSSSRGVITVSFDPATYPGAPSILANFTVDRIGDGRPNSANYFRYTGSETAMSYTYSGTGVQTDTTFYKQCNSTIGSSPGSAVFTEVTVNSLSAEAQNYANWYSYYRTRMVMMKSAVSLAFKNIDAKYRVGFSTISSETATEDDSFLNIRDFNSTQKALFYTKLNAAQPIVNTPLRAALAKAGQYYGNKARDQSVDPVQYSCQKNFTILSTDGYWNTADESSSAPRYGPYQLDNATEVGQQDGDLARPMRDGATTTKTTTSTWTTSVGTITTVVTPQTNVSSTSKSTVTSKPTSGLSRTSYTLPSVKRNFSSVTRCGSGNAPCDIDVTTTGAHGLSVGDSITITGVTPSVYNGVYSVTEVTSSTKFTYQRPTRPASYSSGGSVALTNASACSVGQGIALGQEERSYVYALTTTTVVSGTSTGQTLTVAYTRTDSTKYTRIVVESNGVVTGDNTTPGTVASGTVSVSATVTGTSVTGNTPTTTTGTTTYGYSDYGTASFTGSCVAAAPATSAASSIAANTTGTASPVTSSSSSGPTISNGAGVTTTSTFGPSSTPVVSASSSVTSGGANNTLADVAAYYYKTDLRTSTLGNCAGALGSGTDVCENNVPGSTGDAAHSGGDSAAWQHMTTFTLGLGAGGTLRYDANYLSQATGDFANIVSGSKNWPAPNGGPANIDDLWHAAVNGRGQYFSASDPGSLAVGLNGALAEIKSITGAGAAAATSSLQPITGDNDAFVALFTSLKWTGDVLAYKINPVTAAFSSTATWSAQTQLDLLAPASRNIYYSKFTSGVGSLRAFNYTNLNADGMGGYFTNFCSKTGADGGSAPAQCSTMNSTNTFIANSGTNMVEFLRGVQTYSVYRDRQAVLGDVINASPVYVGKPRFKYNDASYTSFSNASTRTGVVYAAANDGMLHAFARATGNEIWAYVPSFVMPNMYKLADTSYAANHSYYVDGAPTMGDIKVGSTWKTIVVGGLNAGGRGYYALDVTIPASPKILWEFSNDDLGLSFGNPIITKNKDGVWVVVFASGYNNVSPGNGNGYLFVLNADTGAIIDKIPTYTSGTTPAGSAATPSGLAKLNAWVDTEGDNVAKRFYGGDLLGNLWRFDVDSLIEPNHAALLLAELKVGSTPQPITTRPVLAEVNYNGTGYPVVYVATGQYLGSGDLTDTRQNSIYAIKDPLTNTPYGDIRSTSALVTQTFTNATKDGLAIRKVTGNPVDWTTKSGWRVDFLSSGERANVNPAIVFNTLLVPTTVPNNDACSVGGSSWLYSLDIGTGSSVSNAEDNQAGTQIIGTTIQGIIPILTSEGDGDTGTTTGDPAVTGVVINMTLATGANRQLPLGLPSAGGTLKRTSWRELVD